ncbi:MAG TPA: OB-fold nucleic acid binding domain-containing protein, partial [Gemmatimonadota bacterium]|nr:OB-fold nucleic acid binding domain-containing protein [Gemmatimonadota bacterium]
AGRERAGAANGRGAPGAPPIVAGAIGGHAGERVTMVGYLTTTKRVRTKRDEPMMFLTLEDETDIYDVVLFPRAYQRWGDRLVDRGPYVVTGRVEDDPHPSSVTAERLERLEET